MKCYIIVLAPLPLCLPIEPDDMNALNTQPISFKFYICLDTRGTLLLKFDTGVKYLNSMTR